MVEQRRKKGESFESFLRRFNKSLLSSRKLNEIRQKRYLQSKKNKNKQKEYALASMKIRRNNEYLKKTGKLKEKPRRRW
ncbi:MAG: 30S ribosomal protein S21 [Patescibacteria group bacterium]|nr:30S ribosomal protein S21 [Patescibacteria group bacterium]